MSSFPLKIVTPDGLIFDGQAQRLIVRTSEGDMAVMARHINYVVPLGMGRATVVDADGNRRYAACIGGMNVIKLPRVSSRLSDCTTTIPPTIARMAY